MMNKLLVIFFAFITTIIFFQLNTGRSYAQETCTGTTCGEACYDPAAACSSGFFRCVSGTAQCCGRICGPSSEAASCQWCPEGYNYLCSSPETGYIKGCCPQGQTCPLVDGEYVQPSSCPGDYPKYCSSTNSCISNEWDCENYVQNCGGYDYWFCPLDSAAYCTNNTPGCAPPGVNPTTATFCGGEIYYCPTGWTVSCFNDVAGCTYIENPTLFTQFPAPLNGETIDQIFVPNELVMSNTDQDNYLFSPSIYQSLYTYQTFTAGTSGTLSRVAIKVFKLADVVSGNIKLAITGVVDGLPSNTLLTDEVIIPPSDLVVSTSPSYRSNPNDVIAQFNTKPQLIAGQTYAIRIRYTGDTTPLTLSGVVATNPSNGYPGGLICYSDLSGNKDCPVNNTDITFATYIVSGGGSADSTPAPTATPAPSSTPAATPQPSLPPSSPAGCVEKDTLEGDKSQTNIPFDTNCDHIYQISGNLNISGNNVGSKSGVVFVDGNLNFTENYTYGSATEGSVFVVSGDVNIYKDVTSIDAVIISNGIICTAFDFGTSLCPGTNIVTLPLTVNGSLISIKQPDPTEINPQEPIRFRRSLLDNNPPAETINHQVKYLVILRKLFSDTWQKWSEIP